MPSAVAAMRVAGRRWLSSTARLHWKQAQEDRGAPAARASARTSIGSPGAEQRAAMVPVEADAQDRTVMMQFLTSRQEIQHLLGDALSPYGDVDPVLMSQLLTDDLPSMLQKWGLSEEEFLRDYDQVRGLRTSTRQLREAFRKKYKFDPIAVVYREKEHVLPNEELKRFTNKLMVCKPERTAIDAEYKKFEQQLTDMFNQGYTFQDCEDLKRWLDGEKAFHAVVLHQHNVLGTLYRACVYTQRIDGWACDKMFNPRYLPTWEEATEAFRLDLPSPENWKPQKQETGVELARRVDDYNRSFNGIYTNISYATFIPYFFDAHMSCHPLKYHCKTTSSLIFPTYEYINGLAQYLVERAQKYRASDIPIVEVGAGTGRLTYLLNETEAFKTAKVRAVATDLTPNLNPFTLQYPRSQRSNFEGFDVEAIGHNEAVQKYNPAIVLCAMMPNGVDWPAEWRKNQHVLEYVLVGPADGIACGRPWATWGYLWGPNPVRTTFVPTFISDGFKKMYIDEISRYIIGQDDHPQFAGQNRVVSFRRMTPLEKALRLNGHRSKPVLFVAFFFVLAYFTAPEVQ